jgi:integrase
MSEDYRLGRLRGGWCAVWYDAGGKRHRWRLAAKSPAEARAALARFARDRESILRPNPTIEEIWADYVADRTKAGKLSVGRMEDAWKRLAPHFGNLFPDDISTDLVRDYTAKRRETGASDGTIHTELGYLRAALRKRLKGRAPEIPLPPKPRPRHRYLTPEEARRLIDATQMPHVRLFILLALYTAGRPSSILDLQWDRVDLLRGVAHLDNPARDRTSKGRATVPIPDVLRSDLRRARESALTDYVIEWAGKPVKSIKRSVQRSAERAGLSFVTPYVLRHTAAVWMAEAGVPMSEISQYLGHTSTKVTERTYARYSPDYLRKAGSAISTALAGRSEPKPVNE